MCSYFIGIIDILMLYTQRKKLENVWKTLTEGVRTRARAKDTSTGMHTCAHALPIYLPLPSLHAHSTRHSIFRRAHKEARTRSISQAPFLP